VSTGGKPSAHRPCRWRLISRAAIRRSPRKAEKRPVYVLNITLPRAEVDNCLDPAKAMVQLRNRESLCSMLVSLVQSFLFRNGFATRVLGKDADSPSPRKKRRTRPGAGEDDELPALPPPPRRRPTAPAVELVVDPGNIDSEEVVWTDPQTGQSYIVDMATGNSYPMDRSRAVRTQQGINAEPAAQRRRTLGAVPTRHTVGAERPRPKHEDAPEWIRKALGVSGWLLDLQL
jgi:DNA mismatch repair protein MLH3